MKDLDEFITNVMEFPSDISKTLQNIQLDGRLR